MFSSSILENDVQGMDDAGNVAENGENDVDEQMDGATGLDEHTKRRQQDGAEHFENVRKCDRHISLDRIMQMLFDWLQVGKLCVLEAKWSLNGLLLWPHEVVLLLFFGADFSLFRCVSVIRLNLDKKNK